MQLALDWQEENRPNQYWARRYDPGFETSMAFLRTSEQKRADELAESERRQAEEAERTKRELEQAQALAEADVVVGGGEVAARCAGDRVVAARAGVSPRPSKSC